MHSIKRSLFKVPSWVSKPTCIQFDTHNYCNLSCLHCNVKQNGSFNLERGAMKDETYIKVLEYFRGSKIDVATFMNGEPLLETRLDYFNNLAGSIMKAKVIIDTNGTLPEHRYKLLNENIKTVRVTINSYKPDTYELIHGKPLLNQAIATLAFLRDRKSRNVELCINHIVNKHNIHELADFLKYFKQYPINVFPVHYAESQTDSLEHRTDELKEFFRVEPSRKITYPNLEKERRGDPCQCFNILGIGQKGEIMQCVDFPAKHNYGNIHDTDILTAWKDRIKNGMDNECCNSCSVRFPSWKKIIRKYAK